MLHAFHSCHYMQALSLPSSMQNIHAQNKREQTSHLCVALLRKLGLQLDVQL